MSVRKTLSHASIVNPSSCTIFMQVLLVRVTGSAEFSAGIPTVVQLKIFANKALCAAKKGKKLPGTVLAPQPANLNLPLPDAGAR
jgi:hypothetical protein